MARSIRVSVGSAPVFPGADLFVLGETKPTSALVGLVDEGAAYTDVTGDTININAPQTHYRKRFKGHVVLGSGASGTTFDECIFQGPPTNTGFLTYGLLVNEAGATNVTVNRSLFRPTIPKWWVVGFKGGNVTFTRTKFIEVTDGAQLMSGFTAFDGCWFRELAFFDNSEDQATFQPHPYWTHNDGVQFRGIGTGRVRGCLFEMAASTNVGMPATLTANGYADLMRPVAITMSPDQRGPINDALITQNWIYGGEAGFQMNALNPSGSQAVGEISYNRFDRTQHDMGSNSRYQIRYRSGLTFTGLTTNTFEDTGATFAVGFNTGIRVDA